MNTTGIILILCLLLHAHARVIYVGHDGRDAERCGKMPAARCKTIRYAITSAAGPSDVIRVDPTGGDYTNETAPDYTTIEHTLRIVGENVAAHGRVSIACQTEGSHKLYRLAGNPHQNKELTLTLENIKIGNCKQGLGAIMTSGGYLKIFNGEFVNNNRIMYHPQDIGESCTSLRVFIANSIFTSNYQSKPYMAGLTLLGCQSLSVSINNTTMTMTSLKLQASESTNVQLYNVSLDGRGLRSSTLDLTISNETFISLSHCTIKNHQASHDSAVSIAMNGPTNSTPNIHFKNVNFHNNNRVASNGAALSVFSRFESSEKPYVINMDISNCSFVNNSAHGNGGAIYAEGVSKLDIRTSTFINNSAYSGGAIYSDGVGNMTLVSSQFQSNKAHRDENTIAQAGALFAIRSDVDIDGSQFENNTADFSPNTILVSYTTSLTIRRSYFESSKSDTKRLSNNMIKLHSEDPSTNQANMILKNNTFNITDVSWNRMFAIKGQASLSKNQYACPKGLNVSEMSSRAAITDEFNYYQAMYWCEGCPTGSFDPSQYGGGQVGNSDGGKHCMPCPEHAQCAYGQAKAVSNYWGRKSSTSNDSSSTVDMILCPPRQCCHGNECESLDSCPDHKEGLMCSRCSVNHTFLLGSKKCTDADKCSCFVFNILLSASICIGALGLMCLIAKMVFVLTKISTPDVDEPLLIASTSSSMNNAGSVEIDRPVLLADDDEFDDNLLPASPTLALQYHSKHNIEMAKNTIASLPLVLIYCQLATEVFIPTSRSYAMEVRFADVLNSVVNFRFPFIGMENFCSFESLGLVGRIVYQLIESGMLWVFVFVFFLIAVALSKCCAKCCVSVDKVVAYFGFLLSFLLLVSFIPVSSNYIKLTHCVEYDGEYVLYDDATVVCDPKWQILVIVYLSVFMAPLCLVISCGTALVRHFSISFPAFVTAVFFPIPALIVWLIVFRFKTLSNFVGHSYSRGDDILRELQDDNVILSPGTKAVTCVFHGPFHRANAYWYHFNWFPVIMIQSFGVILITNLLSHDPNTKSVLVLLLLFLSLAMHVTIYPFGTKFLNRLQTTLLAFLCVLGFLAVYSSLIYTNNIRITSTSGQLLTISEWVYDILLVLPVIGLVAIATVTLIRHACTIRA